MQPVDPHAASLQEGIANLQDAVTNGSWTICREEAQALLDMATAYDAALARIEMLKRERDDFEQRLLRAYQQVER